jgi:hypothetical protein
MNTMLRNPHPTDAEPLVGDAADRPAETFGDEVPTGDAETGEIKPEEAADAITSAFGSGVEVLDSKTDAEAAQDNILKRMAKAQSLDDLFGVFEGKSSQLLVGKVVTVTDFELGWYTPRDRDTRIRSATILCSEDDKELDFFTTAPNLVGFCIMAKSIGAVPFTAKIASDTTRAGFNALRFERA